MRIIPIALASIRRVIKPEGIGVIMLKKGFDEEIVVDDNRIGNDSDKRFFCVLAER